MKALYLSSLRYDAILVESNKKDFYIEIFDIIKSRNKQKH